MSVVRSPVRSVVRSPVRSVFGGGDTQTDLQRLLALSPSLLIWPANGAGWQGTSGGTLAASGQPLGLGADLSQLGGKTLSEWLATAPELVTNGGFDSDTTGWTAGNSATLSAPSGVFRVENGAANFGTGSQQVTVVAGRVYVATYTASGGTSGFTLRFGSSAAGTQYASISATGAGQVVFTAANTTLFITAANSSATLGLFSEYDNISVRELPGNHLRAGTWATPSDAARGTFQNNAINFSGVDDYYSLLNAIPITESMTVVRAFKRASAGINTVGMGTLASATPIEGYWRSADNLNLLGLPTERTSAANTSTGSFVTASRRNASALTLRLNGTEVISNTPGAASGSFETIGRRSSVYNSGELSFIMVVDETVNPLTDANLTLVEQIAAGTNGATLS
jgi:hypothetical protein